MAHATGFHGHAYLPIAKALAPRFHTYGIDFRGHGDTHDPMGGPSHGMGTATRAFAAAAALAALPGRTRGFIVVRPLVGGASPRHGRGPPPELFRVLVLFEPIIFPSIG